MEQSKEEQQKADRSKILERIRKLMALGTSSNQAEAELAMQRAQELMQAHMVDEAELDRGNVEKIEHLFKKKRVEKWANYLMSIIARNNFCLGAILEGSNWGFNDVNGRRNWFKKEPVYIIYGRPLNIKVVQMMFDYLVETAERLAKEHVVGCARGERTIRRNNFLLGFVETISERLEQQRKSWLDEDPTHQAALVKVSSEDERDIKKRMNEEGQRVTNQKSQYQPSSDEESYEEGKKAGKAVALHRQVHADRKQLTGG